MKPQLMLIAMVGLLLIGDAHSGDAGKTDIAKLEGTWTLIQVERSGQKGPVEAGKNTLAFKGNKVTVKVPVANLDHEGTFKLDPTKKPKQADMTATTGPSKGQTVQCIYELQGEYLRLSMGGGKKIGDAKRPTAFSTQKDDPNNQVIWVLKKQK